ncbi:unnamed protein product [Brassicogethes aeneus]|uniref:Uncharacterized protein n=1 Tax=Brassicogethes aeneus TaxID=1431903 RepID=A0A9P0BC27_BRAAE|nr:unnamed protein product [Brassicogethes aeneus]
MELRTHDKNCPSMQQSSSQFFYFLRLMQLFPDTHPATLHTVLTLCKNDFFCAVDKLLYAKRCKVMYNRRQNLYQKFSQTRSHPYQSTNAGNSKCVSSQQKDKNEVAKVVAEKPVEVVKKQSVIVKANETIPETIIEDNISITINDLTNSMSSSPNGITDEVKDLSCLSTNNETSINIPL